MVVSSFKAVRSFKSPLSVVAAFLFRSRETKARKCEALKQQVEDLREDLNRSREKLQHAEARIRECEQRIHRLELEKAERAQGKVEFPPDPPVGTHGYGARLISLAVNLAQKVGLRGSQEALQIFWEWWGVTQKVPHWTTIRNWLQRLGLAALTKPLQRADDWIWLADHSNQIGVEKVLVVLGVRASGLPLPGTTLKHDDVRLLKLQVGTSWKKEDVAASYAELAEQIGEPRALVVDGAPELHDGAACLKTQRTDTIVLRDFKHQGANAFKTLIGHTERFTEFNKLVGQTRIAIQQTELAHLIPPTIRQKARFMNVQPVLRWATWMLWLLANPDAKARRLFTRERLEEKLGWLRSFATEIVAWNECEKVISTALKFLNSQGLFHGAAEQLTNEIVPNLTSEISREMARRLIGFVSEAQSQLKPHERLWQSTEILESAFSLFKQLEGQHSKSGFTTLLSAFGSLLKTTTPEQVREAFSRVSVKDVHQWNKSHLKTTLHAKRMAAYREFIPKIATI